jgi:hypothetical protein
MEESSAETIKYSMMAIIVAIAFIMF